MSQRDSGYERKERDLYETPEWVTDAVVPHLPLPEECHVWEAAAGNWKMVWALAKHGYNITGTDISDANGGSDFFRFKEWVEEDATRKRCIVTNPPYVDAPEFIEHALELSAPGGLVAMLLRTDFDHAKTRAKLFTQMPFAKKVVLTKRIKWFEDSAGSPSFNHAWFIWDWKHQGAPTLAYGP